MLRLPGEWVWDSWIADDGERYHLYFLHAPRTDTDPAQRHTRARIGHATSVDLTHWEVHDDALVPSTAGWDDLALWTGSVVRADDGVWWMFYTALSTSGHGVQDQRIGAAVSHDLHRWERVGDHPLIEADERWYETLRLPGSRASETWRDPFVFRDPGGDGWHALITARRRDALRLDDGVLAHARSHDLERWEVGPPISAPDGFGQLEVPQVRSIAGEPVLVFTCHPVEQSPERREVWGDWCTWSVVGGRPTEWWDVERARPLRGEPHLFAAQLVRDRDGRSVMVGFRHREAEGIFDFAVADPVPVELHRGELVVTPD